MKKGLIVFALIMVCFVGYSAHADVAKKIKIVGEFVGNIGDIAGPSAAVYKVVDGKVTCYVSLRGQDQSISCVK